MQHVFVILISYRRFPRDSANSIIGNKRLILLGCTHFLPVGFELLQLLKPGVLSDNDLYF